MIRQGTYISPCKKGDLVPCSDAAGEVEEIGEEVKMFKKVCWKKVQLMILGRSGVSDF